MIDPHATDGLLLLGVSLVVPGIVVMIAILASHSHRPNWSRGKHHWWHFRH